MPEIPKGAKSPTDHAKPAAQIEAEGEPTIDIEWNGHTFTIGSDPDDYPVETVLAFENGLNVTALQGLLGPTQWADFMKDKPKRRDVVDLFETFNAALGFGSAGE